MSLTLRKVGREYALMGTNGEKVGRAWKFTNQTGFGIALPGVCWRNGEPTRGGNTTARVLLLRDVVPFVEKALPKIAELREKQPMKRLTPRQVFADDCRIALEEAQHFARQLNLEDHSIEASPHRLTIQKIVHDLDNAHADLVRLLERLLERLK